MELLGARVGEVMKRQGICKKCGKETIVQDHHMKGYNTDDVVPYCQSCDLIAHAQAKREGSYTLPSEETARSLMNIYSRRSWK